MRVGVFLMILLSSTLHAYGLGQVVERFEGGHNPCAVVVDGSGYSYGLYQMYSEDVVAKKYFKSYQEKLGIRGVLGSAIFNVSFIQQCKKNKSVFTDTQRNFIKKVIYVPIRLWADQQGIPRLAAVNEALFSIAVQHGKAKKVIQGAGEYTSRNRWLFSLYTSRINYVLSLRLPEDLKNILVKRYQMEFEDILSIPEHPDNFKYL